MIIASIGRTRPLIASGLLVATLALQWIDFRAAYRPYLGADFSSHPTIQIANFLKRETPQDSAILALGFDWSPELAYYAERKALTLMSWAPIPQVKVVLSDPAAFVAPLPLSAIVRCTNRIPGPQFKFSRSALKRLPVKAEYLIGGCEVYLLESL